MAKKKLLDDMLHNPSRFYRMPGDVLRDRRFSDDERAAILTAWRDGDSERAAEIDAILAEVQSRIVNHAAE